MIPRSYLFVPGDRPEMLAKAPVRGADALIVDLEDAVAPGEKEAARAIVAEWVDTLDGAMPPVWLRINSGTEGVLDLQLLDTPSIEGVMIPKVAHSKELANWSEQIATTRDSCSLLVLIETAGAMQDVFAIAAFPRVVQLMIGEADFGAEIGMTPEHPAWDALRVHVVVASAAAGISPPIGPVDPDFSDPKRLEAETRHLAEMGFSSRAIIHPNQLDPVHRALSPSPNEVERARATLARHEEALAAGRGAHVSPAGTMVDEAIVRRARKIIATARDI